MDDPLRVNVSDFSLAFGRATVRIPFYDGEGNTVEPVRS